MFWFDGKQELFFFPPGYEVSVVSVGAGDSVAFVETASVGSLRSAAGSITGAAVTVTEAGGAVVEMGRSGLTP